MKKSTWIMCLGLCAAVLAFTAGTGVNVQAAESASEGFDPLDTSLTIDGNTYTFPDTVENLQEAGLQITVPKNVSPDKYYLVDAEDANKVSFTVYVERLDGVMYATGYQVEASDGEGTIASGISLDDMKAKTLQKQLKSLEEQGYEGIKINKEEFAVYTMHVGRSWNIYLDKKNIRKVSFQDSLLRTYGTGDAAAAKKTSKVPDDLAADEFVLNGIRYGAKSTIQDLMDNGWKMTDSDLKAGKSTTLQPNYYSVSGAWLCNGDSMIYVTPYNTNTQTKKILDCSIGSIKGRKEWNTDIHLTKGLTLGSSLKDFEGALGEQSKDTFTLENGEKISVAYPKDKSVYEIVLEKH
ncbi:MAG: hypothetical protein Q4B22_10285 [Eubacteriales bacterium]|nr:hypothetical protein [Eubacteriales bacterium]